MAQPGLSPIIPAFGILLVGRFPGDELRVSCPCFHPASGLDRWRWVGIQPPTAPSSLEQPLLPLFTDPYTPSSPSAPSGAGSCLPLELQLALTQHPGPWLQELCLGPFLFLPSEQGWGNSRAAFRGGAGPSRAPGQRQRGTGFPCLIRTTPGGGRNRQPEAQTEM